MEIKNTLMPKTNPYRADLERTSGADARRAARTAQEAVSKPQGDVVTVSSEALLRTEGYRAANAAPEIRREKVDEIKERVASGAYVVDSRKIAEKLLESDALLTSTLRE